MRGANPPKRLALLAIVALVLCTLASGVDARERPATDKQQASLPNPLRLSDAMRVARSRRAEIRAAKLRAVAASERADVVSAVDDPMLMTSIDHLPFELHGVDASAWIQQSFPMSGVLGDRGRAASAEARGHRARADTVVLDVEFEAASAFLWLYEARGLARILASQVKLADELAVVAAARLAAGGGNAAEVLRAESEAVRLRAELRANRATRRAAAARLNTALGRRPTSAVPPLAMETDKAAPKSTAALLPLARRQRPELRAMRAEITRTRAELEVMQSMYGPMAVVGIGFAYTMADGPGLMTMAGVSLPLNVGRNRAGVREARAMQSMAEADLEAMTRMVEGEVAVARAQLDAERERLQALSKEVVPRAQQAADATLAAYGSAQLTLVAVLEAFGQLWNARRSELAAAVALGQARAQLDRALGTKTGRR